MASAAEGEEDNRPEDQGRGWRHIPRLHTCRHCDRIVITHRELKHCLVSLPHTSSEALQAMTDHCPVFVKLGQRSPSLASHPYGSLQDFLRFLFDPKHPRGGYFASQSTANSSRIAAQEKPRSNNIRNLLWRTQFVLGRLRGRHFYLFVGTERLRVLHGTLFIDCNVQLKRLEGMYMVSLLCS